MNRSPRPKLAPALLALIVIAACRTSPPQPTPATARAEPRDEPRDPSAAEAPPDTGRPRYTEADVRFMRG